MRYTHVDSPLGPILLVRGDVGRASGVSSTCRRTRRAPSSRHGSGRPCWTSRTARPPATGKQAAAIGAPTAFRAVGLANGRNPISIIVPCHRVVGANGSLTGYGGGTAAKQWLLTHEASHVGLFATLNRGG